MSVESWLVARAAAIGVMAGSLHLGMPRAVVVSLAVNVAVLANDRVREATP